MPSFRKAHTLHTPTLRREISGFGGLLLTLTVLSPGIGVFIVGSDVLHGVGSGAFLCFFAAVILGIAMDEAVD